MLRALFIKKQELVVLLLTFILLIINLSETSGFIKTEDLLSDSLLIQKSILFQDKVSTRNFDSETDFLYNELVYILDNNQIEDGIFLANLYYFLAAYCQNRPEVNGPDAILNFEKASDLFIKLGIRDETFSKACTNLGILYLKIDPLLSVSYSEEGLRVRQELFGSRSSNVILPLLALSGSYYEANDYEKAIETATLGIEILKNNPESAWSNYIKLQYNVGSAYLKLGDFSTAKDYFQAAYYNSSLNIPGDTDIILRILNGLAVSYRELNDLKKSSEYFEKALIIIEDSRYIHRGLSNTILTNYSFQLIKANNLEYADRLLTKVVELAKEDYGRDSREYLLIMENYSYFLAYNRNQYIEAIKIYNSLDKFIENNPDDILFINTVYPGYAMALSKLKRYTEAIEKINIVLSDTLYLSDRDRLNTLVNKRKYLEEVYLRNNTVATLLEAFEAISSATDLYDRIRVDLSSEQSQLKVAERYDYVYEDCIRTLDMLYNLTQENRYKELLFTYSERSKVSSLLSSTRASRAIKFHIPPELARLESKLEKEINSISELIYNERGKENTDEELIARYEAIKLNARRKDDSLKQVFKRDFPRYNSLKSNTSVAGFNEVRVAIPRSSNFIEYYVSDTILYVYLINRKHFKLLALPYSVEFQNEIRGLRNIIVNPAIDSGARQQYIDYTRIANSLYRSLIEPLKDFLISDRLIIAPDHLLSYIPFEALLSDAVTDSSMNYRKLPFLVSSYDITYAYSGTLLTETVPAKISLRNPALVFAPGYSGEIYIDSIMVNRQPSGQRLERIPGAREEAIFIRDLLGGDLFVDSEASESRFKERAPEGGIIHLAMHTLLNDTYPMYSKMVFDREDDGPNDGNLNTYEVYDIPLNAKMVVLSSCNTGNGLLQSGEGVMSLARGFFYSGSPTVIMSLWEVDDRSGSEVMNRFYRNLKKGASKSKALRNARLDYLKNADQMRSHPYFWCTTVIMGDDGAIFFSRTRIYLFILTLILIIGVFYYRQKPRSS